MTRVQIRRFTVRLKNLNRRINTEETEEQTLKNGISSKSKITEAFVFITFLCISSIFHSSPTVFPSNNDVIKKFYHNDH